MRTVSKNGESSITVERSKFLGHCISVSSEAEAEKFIIDLKRKNPQARHIVYVYKIEPNIIKKYNSTEPSGTGAPPILGLIERKGLTNILVAVVRYFGGVLLGTGGLVRAYSEASELAIQSAGEKELTKYYKFEVTVPYNRVSEVEDSDVMILDRVYAENVIYKIASISKNIPFDDAINEGEIWL